MMLPRIASRAAGGCAVLLALTVFQPAARAQRATPPRTRNVVLIVSDGLRWQEIFTGADPTLMNEKNGGIWDKEQELRREFWRETADERRQALFPFLWTTVAARGQIFGNQTKGSIARVTNGLAFSYPGYNEMLTGHPDPRINSNEFDPNPNPTVVEWLNGLPERHGPVRVYATWATFKDIFNVQRSNLPLQVGWDPPYRGQLTPRQELMNQLYRFTTRLEDGDVYNAFLPIPLLDSLREQQPRVLFVGYGETDNWGHAGRYDLVLHSAHVFDHFVEELWNTLQGLPAYRDQTTFIITTDHGRGSGPIDWKEHGVEQPGSENIWIAVLGPDTRALGERTHTAQLSQAQIAATVAALLGQDYRQGGPGAAPPDGDHPANRPCKHVDELPGIDGLRYVLIDPRLERAPAIFVSGERRHCHCAHARCMPFALSFANAVQQLVAIFAGKSDIADHHIRALRRQRLSGRGRRGRDAHARAGRLEELPHRLGRCRFVLDDQHLHPRELRVRAGIRVAVRNRQFLSSRERQSHAEGRAASLPLTVRADGAAMELHQLPGDGQTQAQPGMLSAGHRL